MAEAEVMKQNSYGPMGPLNHFVQDGTTYDCVLEN